MKGLKNEIERKELGLSEYYWFIGKYNFKLNDTLEDDDRTTESILQEAKKIHTESLDSTKRTQRIIGEIKEVGAETQNQLFQDREELENVEEQLDEIDTELDLAKKQLRSIARKITSSKIRRGLCIIVLIGILGVIIYLIVKPSKAKGSPDGDRPAPQPVDALINYYVGLRQHQKAFKDCKYKELKIRDS